MFLSYLSEYVILINIFRNIVINSFKYPIMKYFLLYLFVISFVTINYSQENKTKPESNIKDFGQVFKIAEPDLLLDKNTKYKVIFDVYTDEKNNKKFNASINTVARFINMHTENGIRPENLDIVLVLHGAATKNALSNKKIANILEFLAPTAFKIPISLYRSNTEVIIVLAVLIPDTKTEINAIRITKPIIIFIAPA